MKAQDREGKWVVIAPVGNLILTKDLGNEYTLGRVTFISGSKLRRIFGRLGLDPRRLASDGYLQRAIDRKRTYAYLHQTGKPVEIKRPCLQLVRAELDLLSASQLYYRSRRNMCRLSLIGEYRPGFNELILLDKESEAGILSSERVDHPLPLTLDKQWKEYHRRSFFGRFTKIIRRVSNTKAAWKTDLTRSIGLVGKSVNSSDISSAFLWNMVALEMLLTRQGDSYSTVIPKRIESLLGWIGFWDTSKFEEKIDEVYKLRCKVVHDGRLDLVTPDKLLFTDDLLVNVLENLLRHPKLFQSKDDLINFADLVGAEHLLGQKSRIRPKQ